MAELSEVNEPAAAAAAPEGTFVSYPDSPFQLFQPYPPAGDQPAAIAKLVEGLNDGLSFQTLLGVCLKRRKSKPALIVCALCTQVKLSTY